MGVTSRSTSGRTSTNSNSQILTMKQVLYAAVIIAFFATSAMANTKCYSCMKLDEATNITRPWKCGQDGASIMEETCGDRVIGCVSEHVKHRSGGGEWEEFRMKHCLDPQRPRPRELVEAVLASGQDPRDMAKSDTIMVCGCTAGKDSGGNSLAAFSALTAVAAAAAKHLA